MEVSVVPHGKIRRTVLKIGMFITLSNAQYWLSAIFDLYISLDSFWLMADTDV